MTINKIDPNLSGYHVKIDPSAINSPLALIALFVAIIELFLIFPITQLTGWDRSILVIFIIAYPIFIASAFFVFLWNKPVNLYTPQTLSTDLQQALLPDKLLAPDRAAVTAIELKISTLETQIRDVSQRVQSSAGMIAVSDVAKLSDLDDLKKELLSRAEAAGDVSRGGIASVAREIQIEVAEEMSARIELANKQLSKFKTWIEEMGLAPVTVPFPKVVAVDSDGPSVTYSSENTIKLGPAGSDYVIPGLYINFVAHAKRYESNFVDGRGELVWVLCEYLSCRFQHLKFPHVYAINELKKNKSRVARIYDQLYKMFLRLLDEVDDTSVEVGVISMINHWNSKSDLQSSFASMVTGMSKAGGDSKRLSSICEEYLTHIAAIKVKDH